MFKFSDIISKQDQVTTNIARADLNVRRTHLIGRLERLIEEVKDAREA